MTIFYSALSQGFFDSRAAAPIPSDGVEVTAEFHAALFDGQSQGKIIVHDGKNLPLLVDGPDLVLDAYHQSAAAALAASDVTMLRVNEAIILGDVTATDPTVIAWATYRRALRAEVKAATVGTLPVRPAFPSGT